MKSTIIDRIVAMKVGPVIYAHFLMPRKQRRHDAHTNASQRHRIWLHLPATPVQMYFITAKWLAIYSSSYPDLNGCYFLHNYGPNRISQSGSRHTFNEWTVESKWTPTKDPQRAYVSSI